MTTEAQSLLTLLGLIFIAVAVWVIVIVWWANNAMNESLDRDKRCEK